MFAKFQLKSIKAVAAVGLSAALLVAVGCEENTAKVIHGEDFVDQSESRDTSRIIDAQKSRGARVDATLYESHFDGPALNSLGMAKLDLMVGDDCPMPLTVWMAIPEDAQAQPRRVSVGAYLKDRGLLVEQIKFGQGANPNNSHLASDGLKGLVKTESDVGASAPGTDSSSSSAGAAAGK